jgi:hypothetical protein
MGVDEHRLLALAWAAPRRPEVHDDRTPGEVLHGELVAGERLAGQRRERALDLDDARRVAVLLRRLGRARDGGQREERPEGDPHRRSERRGGGRSCSTREEARQVTATVPFMFGCTSHWK